MLRGQAYWASGRPELAIDCFHNALEQEETVSNYLAITHYYIEHQDLGFAQEYLNRAFDHARNDREDCLLSQAIIYWLNDKQAASLETFGNTHPRSRTRQSMDELEFTDFWRKTALTALSEIHAHHEIQKKLSNEC